MIFLACLCAQRGEAIPWATLAKRYDGLDDRPSDIQWTTFSSEPQIIRTLDGAVLSAMACYGPYVDVFTDASPPQKMKYRTGTPLTETTIFLCLLQMAAGAPAGDSLPTGVAQLASLLPELKNQWTTRSLRHPWEVQCVLVWSQPDGIHRVTIEVGNSSHAHHMLFKWATRTLALAYAPHRQDFVDVASAARPERLDTDGVEQAWTDVKEVVMRELMDHLFYIGVAAFPMVDVDYLCGLPVQPIAGVPVQRLTSVSRAGPGSIAFQTDDSCAASVADEMHEVIHQADNAQWGKHCVKCGQANDRLKKSAGALEALIRAGAPLHLVCCKCIDGVYPVCAATNPVPLLRSQAERQRRRSPGSTTHFSRKSTSSLRTRSHGGQVSPRSAPRLRRGSGKLSTCETG